MADIFNSCPRRVYPGLINMKYQAIRFGPTYAARDLRFMDRMAELMNLSDGSRTVAQIARIINYEVGAISTELVMEMFTDLKDAGFITLERPS